MTADFDFVSGLSTRITGGFFFIYIFAQSPKVLLNLLAIFSALRYALRIERLSGGFTLIIIPAPSSAPVISPSENLHIKSTSPVWFYRDVTCVSLPRQAILHK